MSFPQCCRATVLHRGAVAAAALILSFWAHAAFASAALIGLTVGGSTDTLVSIDATTGAITTIGSGLPDGFTNDSYALNSANGQYYYDANGDLNVVNTTSGALLGSPSLSPTVQAMAYNAASGTLLGLTVGSSTDALVSINPSTGALTTIGAGTLTHGLANSVYALNQANGQFFYQTAGKLNVADATTGALLHSFTLSTTLNAIAYDSVTGTLLGLTTSSGSNQLVSIDPSTGVITKIGSGGLPNVLTNSVDALNTATGQFIYESSNQLIVVSATTGAELGSPSLSSKLDGIAFPDVSAVPEPAGLAVLLVGLGTLGLLQYRFRSR